LESQSNQKWDQKTEQSHPEFHFQAQGTVGQKCVSESENEKKDPGMIGDNGFLLGRSVEMNHFENPLFF
jgi:hypothetical protein